MSARSVPVLKINEMDKYNSEAALKGVFCFHVFSVRGPGIICDLCHLYDTAFPGTFVLSKTSPVKKKLRRTKMVYLYFTSAVLTNSCHL